MNKYSSEMKERLKSGKSKNHSKKIQVIAIMSDIQGAIKEGYTLTFIWEFMTEKNLIDMHYQTFLRHYNAVIKDVETEHEKSTEKTEEPKQAKRTKAKAFVFNPIPNKDILK